MNEIELRRYFKPSVMTVKDEILNHAARFPYNMGIELEIENIVNLGEPPQLWRVTEDGSLRNGVEFVTRGPMYGAQLERAVVNFYRKAYRYDNTARMSTHIHVNANGMTVGNLRTMFIISYFLESALFDALAAKRKWCGYCMPLTEMAPRRILNLLSATNEQEFLTAFGNRNEDKYYGFNISSVRKHGTVEFRYFPGGPSQDELLDWMDYCTELKTVALANNVEILTGLETPEQLEGWLRANFRLWAERLLKAMPANDMLNLLQEVLAYNVEESTPQRNEQLVFAHPLLLNYYTNLALNNEAQRKWFRNIIEQLKVVTVGDWQYYTSQAQRISNEKKAKAGPARVSVDELEAPEEPDSRPGRPARPLPAYLASNPYRGRGLRGGQLDAAPYRATLTERDVGQNRAFEEAQEAIQEYRRLAQYHNELEQQLVRNNEDL